MKELTIVWNSPRTSAWEATWVEYLFRNIPHTTIENLDHSLFIDNSVIVDAICRAPYHNDYINKLASMNYKFGLVHLTDESTRDNIDSYKQSKFVLRNYYREGMPNNVVHIPLGWNDNFTDHSDNHPASQRKFLWSYVGERWDNNRNHMAAAMSTVPNGNMYVVHHTGPRMSVRDMSRMYRDSIFVPCPRGAISIDNFRVTEAFEAGCIPIVERSDYWSKMHGNEFPAVQIDNWDQAPGVIEQLASNPSQLEAYREHCYNWWEDRKNSITDTVTSIVTTAFSDNASKLISESDKVFWHGYIDFYEKFFEGKDFKSIAELGIFKGNSIRWLLDRFPNSKIVGADILPLQPEWPVDNRVEYLELDQDNRSQVSEFFKSAHFDLIIEDGSHIPQHQVSCLLEGLNSLNSQGLYIIEDIHTSLNNNKGNALTVLLAIDHYHRIGRVITQTDAHLISEYSLMTAEDVLFLYNNIKKISLYRRTHLPNSCYNCGSTTFRYSQLRCTCGVDVFANNDSMSCVIEKY